MRRHVFAIGLLLAVAFAIAPASAEYVQYWALSTHPCTVTDCDGDELNFDRQNQDGEYYYIFNGFDYGATDLNIYETGEQSTITANEPQGLRFKGWWPKAGGNCIETDKTISGAKIKTAGEWNSRPAVLAKYVPIYEITTSVQPAEAGAVTGGGTYEEGAKAVLTAEATAGWAFEKWSDGITTNPRTISDIRAAATYTASFVPTHRTITFDKCGGSGGTDSVVVTNGQPLVKIKPPTRKGYDFQGYFTAATGDDATQYYTSSGAGSRSWDADEKTSALYARWTGKTFNVKFNNDGATSGPDPLTVTYGKDPGPLNIVPAKDDYTFVGYYLGTARYWNDKGEWTGGSGWTYVPEEGNDVILTAHYEAARYTVSFDANGGSGSYEDKSVAVDEEFTLPDGTAYSKERHLFAGWALSAGGQKIYDAGAKTTVKGNKSAASQNPNRLAFYAVWIDLSCTVRFNGGSDEATVQPTEKQVEAGGVFGDLATATWAGNRCSLANWATAGDDVVTAESIVPMGQSVIDLFARWTTNSYSVAFHANGGTGAMGSQVVPFYTDIALSPNLFVRDGYRFAGWATNATDAVAYADGATVRNLATTKDEAVDLYAKWTANDYTVVFYGNGGTNTMAAQAFEYDVEQALSSNRFVREDFTFAGWATDPTNAVAYFDGAAVKNLTTAANGVVRLYAKWTANGGEVTSEFSKALDCENVEFRPFDNEGQFAVVSDISAKGGSCVKIKAKEERLLNDETFELDGSVPCGGQLTFAYRTEIFDTGSATQTSQFKCLGQETALALVGEWTNMKFQLDSSANVKIGWMLRQAKADLKWMFSTNDFVLIDNVRWEPAVTNATTVGVTFRDASGGVFDNVTRKAGEAYGELPVPEEDPLGREFVAWECEGETIDETWTVPAVAAGVEVLSRWGEVPVVTNAVPTAVAGLVYDGKAKTGVPAGEGYAIVGNVATNAGDYTAIATPTEYHVWEGGFGGATNIAWTIAKATVDMSGVTFASATHEWDGAEHSIAVAGVPSGVEVVYSGDATNRTEIGTNTVTASFKVLDDVNYEAITKTLTATLAITAKEDPPPTPPDPPTTVVTNDVPTAIAGLVYDGTEKLGVAAGANYAIVGNVATNAGDYVATATVTNGVWKGGATGATNIAWTIAKATVDMSGVTFASATYEWDGAKHSIAVAGVPSGVEVVYSGDATNRTEIGTNTVTASFKVLDDVNYEAITKTLTATLAITAKEDPPPTPPDPPTPPSPTERTLYSEDQIGAFSASVAATYNGWLEDPASGALLAVLQVKTTAAKPGKVRKTTIYVTPVGGKKKSYKSTIAESGDHLSDGYGIVYGALGLAGKTHGFADVPDGALVQAAKDFTKAKDPAEKSQAARIPIGTWTIAAETASGGYDCLSVTIDKKGKAKVKGSLSDGTTVSVSGYGALGADAFAVPIAYSKDIKAKDTGMKTHVEFAGVLWIAADRPAVLVSESKRWVDADVAKLGIFGPKAWKVGFAVPGWRVYLERTDDGYNVIPAELSIDLTVAKKFSVAKTSGSVKVEKATGKTYVKPSGKNKPANLSKFKLTLTAKTGQVKGSFKLYYLSGGKLKTDSATVTGMMVGDRFYGNVTVKKVGTAPIWFE